MLRLAPLLKSLSGKFSRTGKGTPLASLWCTIPKTSNPFALSAGKALGFRFESTEAEIERAQQQAKEHGKVPEDGGPRGEYEGGKVPGNIREAAAEGKISPSGYTTSTAHAPGLMSHLDGVPLEQRLRSFTQEDGGTVSLATPEDLIVLGLRVTLWATAEQTGGAYSVMEYHVPPSEGSYVHAHEKEHEAWFLLQGQMTWQVADKTVEASQGAFMHMASGTPHAFRNDSDQPSRMLVTCVPAGLEQYFRQIGSPYDGQKANRFGLDIRKPALSAEDVNKAIEHGKEYGMSYPQGFGRR